MLSGGAAAPPPLVRSAFVSRPVSDPVPEGGAPAIATNSAAPTSAATIAPVPAAPTWPSPLASMSAVGVAQAVPGLASAPIAAFEVPSVPAPAAEYLPRYTETEHAPRSPSPELQPAGAVAGSAAFGATAGSAALGTAAGPALAPSSSSGPLSEAVPRAGLGGDSLPIHPSPAQYSAEAPPSAPAVPSSAPPPTTLPAGAGSWTSVPVQTVGPSSRPGEGSAPPFAVPTPVTVPPIVQTTPSSLPPLVAPASFPAASAPAGQPTPASLPPLVPPASFPALRASAPYAAVPSLVPLYGAVAPQDPKLSSVPAAMMKGASTMLKRAVLAMDPTISVATTGHPTTRSQYAWQASQTPREEDGHMATGGNDDLPPMPKPRPIPVSPPPTSDVVKRSPLPPTVASTVHSIPTRQGSAQSECVAVSATSLIGASAVVAARYVTSASGSDVSSSTSQPSPLCRGLMGEPLPSKRDSVQSELSPTPQQISALALVPWVTPREGSERDYAGTTASIVSSRSTIFTSGDTPCSSPATTVPASVSPPPAPPPPPVPVKSPPLAALSPPPVPPRPASIPPLPPTTALPPPVEASTESASKRAPPQDCQAAPDGSSKAPSAALAAVPVVQPRIELQMLDLELPDFGLGFSVTTPVQAAQAEPPSLAPAACANQPPPSSPAAPPACSTSAVSNCKLHRALAGMMTPPKMLRLLTARHKQTARPDPLDDAFEETTTFVAGFAQASLLRATIDPNHTGRTEKWLEQMGVRPRLVSEINRAPRSDAELVSRVSSPDHSYPEDAGQATHVPRVRGPRAVPGCILPTSHRPASFDRARDNADFRTCVSYEAATWYAAPGCCSPRFIQVLDADPGRAREPGPSRHERPDERSGRPGLTSGDFDWTA